MAIVPWTLGGVFCDFHNGDVIPGFIDLMKDYKPPYCLYRTAFILCPVQKEETIPSTVTFREYEIETETRNKLVVKVINREDLAMKRNNLTEKDHSVALCLSSMFGSATQKVGRFIEFVEGQRLLGLRNLKIYGLFDPHPDVKKAAEFYQRTGFVDIIPWDLPVQPENNEPDTVRMSGYPPWKVTMLTKHRSSYPCVRYMAQKLAYNDCLYSFMDEYTALLFTDFDELVVPNNAQNISSFLAGLNPILKPPMTSSMVFSEVQFCPAEKFDPELNLTRSFNQYKGTETKDTTNVEKVLVYPHCVVQFGVHSVKKAAGHLCGRRWQPVDTSLAVNHHYRKGRTCPKGTTVHDTLKNIEQSLFQSLMYMKEKLKI